MIYSPVGARHGSWADGGGYSAEGVVIYDVLNNQALWKECEQTVSHEEQEQDLLDPDFDGGSGW